MSDRDTPFYCKSAERRYPHYSLLWDAINEWHGRGREYDLCARLSALSGTPDTQVRVIDRCAAGHVDWHAKLVLGVCQWKAERGAT